MSTKVSVKFREFLEAVRDLREAEKDHYKDWGEDNLTRKRSMQLLVDNLLKLYPKKR